MVILLMRYGANPYIMDAEGLNCLHIAAQLGFTDIMAYLIGREIVSWSSECQLVLVRE